MCLQKCVLAVVICTLPLLRLLHRAGGLRTTWIICHNKPRPRLQQYALDQYVSANLPPDECNSDNAVSGTIMSSPLHIPPYYDASCTSMDTRIPQTVVELPATLPTDAATAFCNHGYMMQGRAGADYGLIEDGIALFRRYDTSVTVARPAGLVVDSSAFNA